jgi:hypothetical protein
MRLRGARPRRAIAVGDVISTSLVVQAEITPRAARLICVKATRSGDGYKSTLAQVSPGDLEPGGHDRTELAPRHLFGSGFGRRSCRPVD